MRENRERGLRSPSPATVMSALALFVSLSGVGYAAAKIGSAQIKNNSVASKDIKNSTIASKDIKNKGVGVSDLSTAALAGLVGPQGPAGAPGRSALSSLKSGERIYGVYGAQGQGPNLWTGVTFPIPAPTPVDSLHVVIAANDTVTGDGCTGTKTNPVSAPGFVCMYPHISGNTTAGFGWGALCACANPAATGDGSRFGFMVQGDGGAGVVTFNGVWVYTAP